MPVMSVNGVRPDRDGNVSVEFEDGVVADAEAARAGAEAARTGAEAARDAALQSAAAAEAARAGAEAARANALQSETAAAASSSTSAVSALAAAQSASAAAGSADRAEAAAVGMVSKAFLFDDPSSAVPTVRSALLPSYVDDVLEFDVASGAEAGQTEFPQPGEAGKIYVDKSSGKTYRWSGSAYVAVGVTDAVQFVEQSLSLSQQERARTNIGAVSEADVETAISNAFADRDYRAISVTAFSANPANVENGGGTVASVTLSWSLSKAASSVSIDGEPVTGSSKMVTGSFGQGKTWTISATETQGPREGTPHTATRTVSLGGLYKRYYGTSAIPESVNSSFVHGLASGELASAKNRGATSFSAGTGQYLWYAHPSAWDVAKFVFGGTEVEFDRTEIDYVLPNGSTVKYYVYHNDRPGLGSVSITIS